MTREPVFLSRTIARATTEGHRYLKRLIGSSIKRERRDEINFYSLWRKEIGRQFLRSTACCEIAKRERLNQLKFSMVVAECMAIAVVEYWGLFLMERGVEWSGANKTLMVEQAKRSWYMKNPTKFKQVSESWRVVALLRGLLTGTQCLHLSTTLILAINFVSCYDIFIYKLT